MKIGYACLTVDVPDTSMKRCIMKNATETRLLELISHNLDSLDHMMNYNIENNIQLFRISSDVIPFGSSPVNQLPWWEIFQSKFVKIGNKIKENGIRVSMHPGQYTVINSPNEDVVKRAIDDLEYHSRVLDSLGVGIDHKIILHIGGVYNDKKSASKRFIENFNKIDASVKSRIVIENDDKSFHVCDVIEIAKELKIPVVYDNLHNEIKPCDVEKSDIYWINKCKETWKKEDGTQKIHYSQQDPDKKLGSHSSTIDFEKFLGFYSSLKRDDIDIMLEVKDKNVSAVNCIRKLNKIT